MSKPPSASIEPTVLAVRSGDGRAELDLVVPPDLLYCRGHFRNRPILPGVVQIDWAIRLGRRHLQLGPSAPIALKVKFRRLVHPGDCLTLDLRYQADCKRLFFDYRDRGEARSTGHAVFEP